MPDEPKKPGPCGLLVLDKPTGITSRGALDQAAKWFPRGTPLGHAGTLDPLATGILVVCAGWATRLVEYVQLMPKTYQTVFTFGATSETDDSEGPITPLANCHLPAMEQIVLALEKFQGEISQVPPAHSAARVDGKRAYRLARQGQPVLPPAKKVFIQKIKTGSYQEGNLQLEITCGKGTYIRSMARDLGALLGTGAFVSSLQRTRIGPFHLNMAVSPLEKPANLQALLLPCDWALQELPRVTLPSQLKNKFVKGTKVSLPPTFTPPLVEKEFAVNDEDGNLVAVGTFDPVENLLCPRKVLPLLPELLRNLP